MQVTFTVQHADVVELNWTLSLLNFIIIRGCIALCEGGQPTLRYVVKAMYTIQSCAQSKLRRSVEKSTQRGYKKVI